MDVYLSSTLKDLLAEREAVKQAFAGLHTVVESYDADEESLRISCLDDVARCELYIGIVGLRYGFIPPDPPGNNKSITELEFEAASIKPLPRLLFLKDEGAILATMTDSHTKEHAPTLIEDFRARLTSGENGIPRPTVFSTPDDLKVKLLRALSRRGSDREEGPFVPAPGGDSELQRMLSKCLNRCWPGWGGVANLVGARFCHESETIETDPKGMPCDLFGAAVSDDPLKLLKRLDEFIASGPEAGALPAAFRKDPMLREIVLHTALVAAERYVLVKKEKDKRGIQEDEILSGDDERLNCILAAASFGFGIRLEAGQRFPRNFARFPAAELGHENPRDVIALELYAQAQRMKGVPPAGEAKADGDLDEDILMAELEDIRSLYGCGLVATDHHQGPLSDASLRHSIREDLGVPTVLFGPLTRDPAEGARWLLNNLKRLIGPLLDAALGPLTPAIEADNTASANHETVP